MAWNSDARVRRALDGLPAAAVARAREVAARFADLLVAAFAVAAGVAWKDGVVWLFSAKGPLHVVAPPGPLALAAVITLVGAALTALRSWLPLTPRSDAGRRA